MNLIDLGAVQYLLNLDIWIDYFGGLKGFQSDSSFFGLPLIEIEVETSAKGDSVIFINI